MKSFTAILFQAATLVTLTVLVFVFWPVLLWLAVIFLVLLGLLVIGIPLWLRYQMKRNFRDAFYRRRPDPAETDAAPPPAAGEVIDTTAVELDDPPKGS